MFTDETLDAVDAILASLRYTSAAHAACCNVAAIGKLQEAMFLMRDALEIELTIMGEAPKEGV